MSTFKPDAGIPLLTEVIDAPVVDAGQPETAVDESPPPTHSTRAPGVDAERWERLENELRERVLQQVLRQIDAALEQRVRDNLADVLQVAVEDLSNQLREGLRRTVKDVVTQAVRQEVRAAQDSKN